MLRRNSILITVFLPPLFSSLLLTGGAVVQLPAEFEQQQRIALAKQILAPARQAAIEDPNSDARKYHLLKYWAAIDPAWTAKFILENPVPDDGLLYDHSAILALMNRPEEIAPEHLRELIAQSNSFARYNYALTAINRLPDDATVLKQELVDIALQPQNQIQGSVMSFESQLKLAKLSQDAASLERVKNQIAEFFQSGTAQQSFEAMKNSVQQNPMNIKYFAGRFARHAPPELKDQFLSPGTKKNVYDLSMILSDRDLSDQGKIQKLAELKAYDFGKLPHEYMMAGAQMGMLAKLDVQLALRFSAEAPDPAARIWCRLAIVPALAKSDQLAAEAMIQQCYDELVELDPGEQRSANYNFPPHAIARAGFLIVEFVNPELMEECIQKTEAMLESTLSSRLSSAQEHRFRTIAAIAKYDRETAKKWYDKFSDDVPLHASPGFFCALVALYPDQVLDELQSMPAKDSRGTDWRQRAGLAILPSLVADSDQGFWQGLSVSPFLQLDSSIFVKEPEP